MDRGGGKPTFLKVSTDFDADAWKQSWPGVVST